jgi:hypothetical protein
VEVKLSKWRFVKICHRVIDTNLDIFWMHKRVDDRTLPIATNHYPDGTLLCESIKLIQEVVYP